MTEKLMTSKQVADYLGVSEGTMYEYRALGIGPKYMRIGGRLVRYRLCDVDAWLEAQKADTK